MSAAALEQAIRGAVAAAPEDAVLRIRISGELSSAQLAVLSARRVRAFVPESMNIEIRTDLGPVMTSRAALRARRRRSGVEIADANLQLEL